MMKSNKVKNQNILQLILLLLIIVLINFIAGNINIRIDLTKENKYTLSPVSKEILKNLEDIVFIKVYLDGKLDISYKKFKRSIEDKLEDFKIYGKSNFEYKFINPLENTEPGLQNEVLLELKKKGINLVPYTYKDKEGNKTFGTAVPGALISYRGNEKPINFLKNNMGYSDERKINSSIESLEYELINMILKITNENPEKIGFIIGHGELIGHELVDIRKELENYYEVYVDIIKGEYGILDNYKAIVIAKPRYSFSENDKFVLDQYIMNGGKVLWLIDVVSVSKDSLIYGSTLAYMNQLNIEDQLFRYGIRINPVLIKDKYCTILPIPTAPSDQLPVWEPFDWLYFPLLSPSPDHVITKNNNYIRSQYINTIDTVGSVKSVKKTILLRTSNKNKEIEVPCLINLNEIEYIYPESYFDTVSKPVAVLLEGIFESNFINRPISGYSTSPGNTALFKKQSINTKMIVIADGDIIRNDYKILPNGEPDVIPLNTDEYIEFINRWYKEEILPSNFDNKYFIVDAINYLTNTQSISELRNRDYKLRLLDKEKISNKKKCLKWQVINTVIPIITVMLFGFIYFYSRRSKYIYKKL